MDDRTEIINKFDTYKSSIMAYLEAVAPLNVVDMALYEMKTSDADIQMNEAGETVINEIPIVSCENEKLALPLLKEYLAPFYRKGDMSTAPRLFGHVVFDGTHEQLAKAESLHEKLNQCKKDWGDELKAQFPAMTSRQRYLDGTPQFKGMSTRSVHRQLVDVPKGTYAAKLSWSCKSFRSQEITMGKELEEVIYRYKPLATKSEIEALVSIAQRRYSPNPKFKLIHRFPILIHPVQTIYYMEGEERRRKPVRPGLPLIIYGKQKIKTKPFETYTSETITRQPNNKRTVYHNILSEFGVYQTQPIEA